MANRAVRQAVLWTSFGIYLFGAGVTFLAVGFMCLLGGNPADLWRPFVYGVLWPLFWLYLLWTVS